MAANQRAATFPRTPESAQRARRIAHSAALGLGDDAAEVVALLTSEVVTNAIVHGAGESFELGVTCLPHACRVEVCDGSRCLPSLGRSSTDDAEHGRGLNLVDELATDWGVRPVDDRAGFEKAVWFLVGPFPNHGKSHSAEPDSLA